MHHPTVIAPSGIQNGDPQALTTLCAARGLALLAYCEAVAPESDAALQAASVFAAVRLRIANVEDPSALDPDQMLLDVAEELAREAGASAWQLEAAERAYLTTPATARLPGAVAHSMLRAAVEAAPVTALDGDTEAVVHTAERLYDEQESPASDPPAAPSVGDAESRWIPAGTARTVHPAPIPPRPEPRLGKPAAITATFAAAALLIGVIIGAAVAIGTGDDGDGSDRRDVRGQIPGVPFDAEGLRLEVVPTDDASWARKLRQRPAGAGLRWVTVAVRMRNADRPGFDPGVLGYRLQIGERNVVGPRTVGAPSDLAVGKRASIHLGFVVPVTASDLTLVVDSRGAADTEIRTPL